MAKMHRNVVFCMNQIKIIFCELNQQLRYFSSAHPGDLAADRTHLLSTFYDNFFIDFQLRTQ